MKGEGKVGDFSRKNSAKDEKLLVRAKNEKNAKNVESSDFLTPKNPLIVAAHELKTPLVLVRQLSLEFADNLDFANSAETDFAKNPELKNELKNAKEIAEKIRLTSEKSLRLMDSLTRAARLDDGLFALEPIRVENVIREISAEMSPMARALGQKIRLKKSRKLPPAIANRELLRALIMNLLDNSLQYNNRGDDVEISAKISENFAKIEVRDFGAPLNLGEFRRLQENLGQAQPVSARPLSSGLGLLVADIFAKKMNGRLDVKIPRRGNGLAFQITLPITRQMSLLELL